MDTDALFREQMRAMALAEGTDLLEEEEKWSSHVPESFCAAGLKAIEEAYGMTASEANQDGGEAPPVRSASRSASSQAGRSNVIEGRFTDSGKARSGSGPSVIRTRRRPRRILLIAAVLALCFTLGFAASPLLREGVSQILSSLGIETGKQTRRSPADYVFPSPGADYTVTQEYEDERVKLIWYHGTADGGCELLAEAAYVLPADVSGAIEFTPTLIGTAFSADYGESGDRRILLLRDGDVSIALVLFHAEKTRLMDYAEKFVRENGL